MVLKVDRVFFYFDVLMRLQKSHYPERASSLDLKDASTPRFSHSDVVLIYLQKHVLCI